MRRKIAIFEVLGVRPEDDLTTIRRAWRAKVKQLHPDVAVQKDSAGQNLAAINAAFQDLKAHQPFVDRRKGPRRRAKRHGGLWTPAQRAEALRQKSAAASKARAAARQKKSAQQQARAAMRKEAEAMARRRAAALDAAEAKRRKAKRAARTPKDLKSLMAAVTGYAAARQATSV